LRWRLPGGGLAPPYWAMGSLPTDAAVRASAHRLRQGLTAPGLREAVAAYFSEPDFAGMTFTDLGRNPPNEIIPDDLLAVSLLDITWRPRVVRLLLGRDGPELPPMLAAIPQATDLWEATDDDLRHVEVMWDTLMATEGIGTASATKLLARKRPRLCPISDHTVIKAIDVPGRTWDVLRCLLQDPPARAEVEALRPASAAGATLLRILDVALWVSYGTSATARWVRQKAEMTAA
jgi:Family of unknown function (DUF6308)